MSEINVAISDGPQPSVKVVALTGEMDEASLEVVKNQIDGILNDSNIKRIIFNLTGLGFINSKGIGYLVSVHTHLSKDQREMVMAGANEVVMDVISLVGLTSIVKYFKTIEEALADSGGSAPATSVSPDASVSAPVSEAPAPVATPETPAPSPDMPVAPTSPVPETPVENSAPITPEAALMGGEGMPAAPAAPTPAPTPEEAPAPIGGMATISTDASPAQETPAPVTSESVAPAVTTPEQPLAPDTPIAPENPALPASPAPVEPAQTPTPENPAEPQQPAPPMG